MSVKIRLQRHGRKQRPYYYIVVADVRSKRDGKFIERLGSYNPMTNPASIDLDTDRALNWIMNGAQPTDTVRAILSYKGVMLRKHLQVGVNKGAITQEAADQRFADWLEEQANRIDTKVSTLKSSADEETRMRLEREASVAHKRAEAIKAAAAEAANPQPEEGAEENAQEDSSTESAE